MITVAGAHDQQLVPCYAASVFMSFQQIGITLVLLMIVLITVIVAISSSIATQVAKVLGIGSTGVTIWNLAKIPVVLMIVSVMFGFLYKTAPNVKQPGAKFWTPGGFVALGVWILASLLFAPLPRDRRLLQQDLQPARRIHRLPRVAFADQPRCPARRRI